MSQKACLQCGVAVDNHRNSCHHCSWLRRHHNGRKAAGAAVALAISAGRLSHPRGMECVDCGGIAVEYDHRDYSKPLEVQPVCRKCNARRGPGKWIQFKPIRDLIAERLAA